MIEHFFLWFWSEIIPWQVSWTLVLSCHTSCVLCCFSTKYPDWKLCSPLNLWKGNFVAQYTTKETKEAIWQVLYQTSQDIHVHWWLVSVPTRRFQRWFGCFLIIVLGWGWWTGWSAHVFPRTSTLKCPPKHADVWLKYNWNHQ